ncbi:hypothetical protein ACN2C7_10175 [Caulobacter sp. ErkDOM-E]|uniref:hypothetical protein n=1 Tax=Caulobacter sp. ErkDOM-E TaxID=3402778 RepID=UPI003AF4505B
MLQALYFPNLSLPESSWVNPAILYFDRIQVIAPMDQRADLYDRRTEELIGEDVVVPVTPGMSGWDREADARFVRYLTQLPGTQRRDLAPARVHLGKLAYTDLADDLRATGQLHEDRDGWLVGPRWAADQVLTYLALQMTTFSREEASLVTDTGAAWTRVTGITTSERRRANELQTVTSLLPVAASTPIRELVRFRRQHARALQEFRDEIISVLAAGSGDIDLRELHQRRDELVDDLKGFNLVSSTVSVAVTALPIGAALVEGSPWSAGAGIAALALGAWGEAQRGRRAYTARRDPMVYAAIARIKLGH